MRYRDRRHQKARYYDQKIEYKRKGKKGKTTKYVPKKSRVLKSKELLIRFTIQEKYKFKNDTIILSNKIRMGHWKRMGRLDIAERCRCDVSAYLESLIAEIDKDCNEIPKEKT